ncbi:Glutaredoxin-3 [Galdieria sulphuraria]|nr:Glutaredoxin-3 [Galdieria sulphuraria]
MDSLSKLDDNIWKMYSRRIQVLMADLTDILSLRNQLLDVDCAILTATSWGGEQAFQVNVEATFQLFNYLPKDCHILYFSTASIIDSSGCLLEEAYRYGTTYLQSKYVALQRMLRYHSHRRITVIFPTLVVGPNSHLANVSSQITPWKGLLRLIDLDASAHFIHAIDAAKVITYLVDFNPKPSFYTWHSSSDPPKKLPAVILGQPYFTADQLIQSMCSSSKKRRFFSIPRIPVLSLLPPLLIARLLSLFGATVDPWVMYCLKKRHFVYPDAVAPENFGLILIQMGVEAFLTFIRVTWMSSTLLQPIHSEEEWKQLCWTEQGWKPSIIGFGASWSQPCVHVREVLETLASVALERGRSLVFGFCEVEEGNSFATAWGITNVPSVVLSRDGELVNVLQGADPPTITRACRDFMEDCHLSLNERLEKLVHRQPIMLFMKGTPDKPLCKFSRRMIEILKGEGVIFGHFNILADYQVREGLKRYANWPTYPQLYVNGELIGGLDIVEELYQAGKLKEELHLPG